MLIINSGLCFLGVLVLLAINVALAQNGADSGGSISSSVVVRPRSMSVDFWTAERMKAAKDPVVVPPTNNLNTGRSMLILTDPQITVLGQNPDAGSSLSRALNTRGRHTLTTGRVFWSCNSDLSSCSAGVVPSTSGDVIVTAGHCVFDTTTLTWMTGCNWIFVPGYINGTAPYGRWPLRQAAALTLWTRSNPDYNYDVAFVALSIVNGKHISQVTGSQSLGFNKPRSKASYSFGYPVNLARGELIQWCSGTPAASRYTGNNYVGQGLSNCLMTGGCSGGPWLQEFDETTGVGTTYSVNSFTYSPAPNTINGPVFDSNTQLIWSYITAR